MNKMYEIESLILYWGKEKCNQINKKRNKRRKFVSKEKINNYKCNYSNLHLKDLKDQYQDQIYLSKIEYGRFQAG